MVDPYSARQPTISDVARVAGVSVPTVSRVLTGATKVSPERHARVQAAIEELGFRPNGAARALAGGRQPMLAVFAGNTTRFGYATTIQGIEEAARAEGLMVVISVVETDEAASVKQAVDLALSQPLSGAIVLEYDPPGVATLAAIPSWMPVVAVAAGGRSEGTIAHAYMDDSLGARRATQYLLELGHATVHHVAIPSAGKESSRLRGWRDALLEAGAPVPPVVQADWDPMSGYEIGTTLLADRGVTAVLCGNDELAMGLIRAAQDMGRRVPDDLSVIGFDDHPLGQLWSPALTTVRQDFVELGRRAFHLLERARSGGDQAITSRIIPDLIVRRSSGLAPRPDRIPAVHRAGQVDA
ncbi:LacI family DNA-binding transcriptional regulator [Cellulomonas sp. McL0617]|uniref:LacI family DNA-binding transcriptional regulator n=1 Tax=Cellulomonas sp. McL0617 TaxID=3415675 RepID=UPI003CF23DF7